MKLLMSLVAVALFVVLNVEGYTKVISHHGTGHRGDGHRGTGHRVVDSHHGVVRGGVRSGIGRASGLVRAGLVRGSLVHGGGIPGIRRLSAARIVRQRLLRNGGVYGGTHRYGIGHACTDGHECLTGVCYDHVCKWGVVRGINHDTCGFYHDVCDNRRPYGCCSGTCIGHQCAPLHLGANGLVIDHHRESLLSHGGILDGLHRHQNGHDCAHGHECITGVCWDHKCNWGSLRGINHDTCDFFHHDCRGNLDCCSGTCIAHQCAPLHLGANGLVIDHHRETLLLSAGGIHEGIHRYGIGHECAHGHECVTGVCWDHKCNWGRLSGINHDTCDFYHVTCRGNLDCCSGICIAHQCAPLHLGANGLVIDHHRETLLSHGGILDGLHRHQIGHECSHGHECVTGVCLDHKCNWGRLSGINHDTCDFYHHRCHGHIDCCSGTCFRGQCNSLDIGRGGLVHGGHLIDSHHRQTLIRSGGQYRGSHLYGVGHSCSHGDECITGVCYGYVCKWGILSGINHGSCRLHGDVCHDHHQCCSGSCDHIRCSSVNIGRTGLIIHGGNHRGRVVSTHGNHRGRVVATHGNHRGRVVATHGNHRGRVVATHGNHRVVPQHGSRTRAGLYGRRVIG